MSTSTDFTLAPEDSGLARLGPNAPGSHDVARELLQKNHEKWHMCFDDMDGHNHIPQAVLTTLAMGGNAKDLTRAYDDNEAAQTPMPAVDLKIANGMGDPDVFHENMQIFDSYPNFLVFFKQEIKDMGSWQAVVNKHCFARTPLADFMTAQLFEGLVHPFMTFGLGVEYNLPGLVAEGLAQASSQDTMYVDVFFQRAERLAKKNTLPRKRLVDLYHAARADEGIRTAAQLSDGPWKVRDGILGRAMEPIINVAAQFQVDPTQEAIERATAEIISCAAWTCGGIHKAGKERKLDYFLMHNAASSIFLSVMNSQDWLSIEDKARLVEYMARLHLVWYAGSAAPEVKDENIRDYQPTASKGMDWDTLYQAVNQHHDDGHVATFVRALKNGHDACAPYEQTNGVNGHASAAANGTNGVNGDRSGSDFPVKGDSFLKIAQMCYDSTCSYVDGKKKWVWGAGFDSMWDNVQDAN